VEVRICLLRAENFQSNPMEEATAATLANTSTRGASLCPSMCTFYIYVMRSWGNLSVFAFGAHCLEKVVPPAKTIIGGGGDATRRRGGRNGQLSSSWRCKLACALR